MEVFDEITKHAIEYGFCVRTTKKGDVCIYDRYVNIFISFRFDGTLGFRSLLTKEAVRSGGTRQYLDEFIQRMFNLQRLLNWLKSVGLEELLPKGFKAPSESL